ncbi:membrane protein [Psychromonas marina]|uniref:Membrane protein n=1 Tax=Psychromonas marina TaxID=88364 RepID=A0ABQ6E0E6_9GAMM|nr:DMT family transporter [Psychromonas marina]GLS90481.1 membrane protein [Psychromonas marina]
MSNKNSYKAILFMLVSTLSLSMTGLMTKYLSANVEIGNLVLLRFFLPSLLLILVLALTKIRLPPKDMRKLLLIRALNVGASQLCFIYALENLSLVESVVLFGTGPIFMTLLERVMFKISIKTSTLISILLTFSGVILLAGQSSGFSFKPEIFIGLLAGLFNAGSQLSLHKASKGSMSSTENNAWTFLYAGLFLLPIITLLNIGGQVELVLLPHWGWLPIATFLIMAMTVITTQAMRYKAYQLADNSSQLAPLIYTNLVFSAILQFTLFETQFTRYQILGLVVIVIANIICTILPMLKQKKRVLVIPANSRPNAAIS